MPVAARVRRLAVVIACLAATALQARPQAPPLAPFFFLQLSDPQFGRYTADKDFAQETVNFEMTIATANRLKPAFVIITGDLVNKAGDRAQIREYRRIAARLNRDIPLHEVPGNHDVENAPTDASIAAYEKIFGPDHYTFSHRGLTGIVINSTVIHTPDKAPARYAAQERWLRDTLRRTHESGAPLVIVFQHHPWFLVAADERDQYYNLPLARRTPWLQYFHEMGLRYVVAGHYHRNAVATDGGLTMITTSSVGKTAAENEQSGIRVFVVNETGLSHRFYALGDLPNQIDPSKSFPR